MTSPPAILVVRLSPIGNFLMAMGLLRDVRDRFEDSAITLVTDRQLATLAACQGIFDRIVPCAWDGEPRGPRAWIEARFPRYVVERRLRGPPFDLVLDLHGTPKIASFFLRGPQVRHARVVRVGPERAHMVDVYADCAQALGIEARSEPSILLPPKRVANHAPLGRYAVLVPRARHASAGKDASIRTFQELAARLLRRHVVPIVVGHRRDLRALRPLRNAPGVLDRVGRLDLVSVASLLGTASLAIGVDTGTTHLGAILGVPTVGLYGKPADVATWGIRGPRTVRVVAQEMEALEVDAIWAQACAFLDGFAAA